MLVLGVWLSPGARRLAGGETVGTFGYFDVSAGVGAKSEQIVRRLRRGAGGADDGAIIIAQDVDPGSDVIGMAHRRHDSERGADEGARNLGHNFLVGILLRAERAGEIAIEAGPASASVGVMPISA